MSAAPVLLTRHRFGGITRWKQHFIGRGSPGEPQSRVSASSGSSATLAVSKTEAATTLTTADHPLMGMWLAMANPARRGQDPQFAAPSHFAADGTCILGFVPAEIGREGDIQYTGSPMGVWEPYDDHPGTSPWSRYWRTRPVSWRMGDDRRSSEGQRGRDVLHR